jgi:hypothetical protein
MHRVPEPTHPETRGPISRQPRYPRFARRRPKLRPRQLLLPFEEPGDDQHVVPARGTCIKSGTPGGGT